jgi:hypothetical protein
VASHHLPPAETRSPEHPSAPQASGSKWLNKYGHRKGYTAFLALGIRTHLGGLLIIAIWHIVSPLTSGLVGGVLAACLCMLIVSSFVYFHPMRALVVAALPILLLAIWWVMLLAAQCLMCWMFNPQFQPGS